MPTRQRRAWRPQMTKAEMGRGWVFFALYVLVFPWVMGWVQRAFQGALPVAEAVDGRARPLEAVRPQGQAVRLVTAPGDKAEAIFVAKEIARMVGGMGMVEAQEMGAARGARSFGDIAVLCRTRRQLALLEECLARDGIPCVVAGREDFLLDGEVQAALAWLEARKEKDTPPATLLEQWTAHCAPSDGVERLRNMAVFFDNTAAFLRNLTIGQEGDLLRRAGVEVSLVGLEGPVGTGSHGIAVTADVTLEGHAPTAESVRYIHLHKTADLLTAPVVAGLMLAGATEAQLEAGRAYGRGIGLAFQIVDDLLDLEGDVSLLGKETGMDAQRGKQTWPAAFGVERSRQDAGKAIEQAVQALSPFGERGAYLRELARKTLVRKA